MEGLPAPHEIDWRRQGQDGEADVEMGEVQEPSGDRPAKRRDGGGGDDDAGAAAADPKMAKTLCGDLLRSAFSLRFLLSVRAVTSCDASFSPLSFFSGPRYKNL